MTRKECEERIIEHLKAIRETVDEYMPGLLVSMSVGKMLSAFAFEPGDFFDDEKRDYVLNAECWIEEDDEDE